MTQSRQLAVIMFTDIVGYTALMGEDEYRAFELLHQNRKNHQTLIEKFKGKWIKELGDGTLASFSTVTDAVLCACAIQQSCNIIPDLKLRIGIHLGDVVFENSDVFGDGVNIASRLQPLAPIGGICVSEAVHKNIANKKGINSKFVQEITLKNVKDPVQIYEIDIESTLAEGADIIDDVFQGSSKGKRKNNLRKIFIWGVSIIIVVSLTIVFVRQWKNKQIARDVWLPEIQKMAEENFLAFPKAFALAKKAEKYISEDSALLKLWPKIGYRFTIHTNPSGADVYWKDYKDTKEEWKLIGTTPIKDVLIPGGFTRIKIEKPGFITVLSPPTFWRSQLNVNLDSIGKLPANMVRVGGDTPSMLIVGLERYGLGQERKHVKDFLMDKYEVTNKEFKRFVDAGGYKNKSYWDQPIYSQDKEISWENAINLFHDQTGKPGPAGWEVGTYPDGKDNHPVTGVSWYEANAYAKFSGKKIPTAYHWSMVANTINTWGILPKSNFSSTGTVPVGSLDGISDWGVYDIGGNAREWCFNESEKKGQYFILGGGWSDPTYAYNDAGIQPALDRSLSNGFRCMKEFPGDTSYTLLSGNLIFSHRNYATEKPVNDEIFKIFLRQYVYDHSPLNAKSSVIADTSLCKIEKIDIDAAYNKERMTAYLYLPKSAPPPYQTIVFYPGSGAMLATAFDYASEMAWNFDFILKSGRAVCYPILKGTFERRDELRSDLQEESVFYKDHVTAWVKDISRSLDYLDTRNDIVHDEFGFYGLSWGSAMSPVVCAVEKRFKAAVLHVGGLMMEKTFPEVDVFNFVPRVNIPVLMLNGKNDTFYPFETSQKPLFNLLGTNANDKKMVIYEGGHLVPKSELIKESLAWFDKYLGTNTK